MNKISIIGSGGSGKSTLAKRIGQLLDIPVHHLDALYWQPNWTETEKHQWAEIQQTLCAKSHWIMDGNYAGTMDIRLNASDTIIFLDVNRYVCLLRAIKRTIMNYGKTRSDMGDECKERFQLRFLLWIYGYPDKKKPGILKKLSQLNHTTQVYVLQNQREVDAFLNDITPNIKPA